MVDTPIKTGGYKKVRLGTDGFRGATASKQSYDGAAHKEVAPNVYKRPQEPRATAQPDPIGGGKKLPDAHGYRAHDGKKHDGPLRMSGHPKAVRVGHRGK